MKLRYSPRARADIADIHEYIAGHNKSAAAAVAQQIRSTSELLARYPGLGRETDISGVRVFPVARYPYLVYHLAREGELIVIHVRDARRDAPKASEL
jgi:plasmid stabilization system protein ParE